LPVILVSQVVYSFVRLLAPPPLLPHLLPRLNSWRRYCGGRVGGRNAEDMPSEALRPQSPAQGPIERSIELGDVLSGKNREHTSCADLANVILTKVYLSLTCAG